MCEEAEEIQKEWKPAKGDFYILGITDVKSKHFGISILGCHWKECESCTTEVGWLRDDCTWLPRQDQLQEMLGIEIYELVYKFDDFSRGDTGMYGNRGFLTINRRNYSMEQLWLTFVMQEKYNKIWDNENWIEK